MVKCTLFYYNDVLDVTEDAATLEAVPDLQKFVLSVEKVKND